MTKLKDSGIPWIGLIPEHWNIHYLRGISNRFSKGNGITKEDLDANGDIACIRYGDLYTKYNHHITDVICRTSISKIQNPVYASFGDIYYTCSGEDVEAIGKSVAYMSNQPCLIGGDLIIMKHNQNPRFLGYSLDSEMCQKQKSCGKSKLKVVHISVKDLKNIAIPIPPLEEQERIAAWLDGKCGEIDELIDVEQQMISDLEAYRQAVITEAVTHGLNPDVEMIESGCDWFTSRPNHWKIERIKNLFAKRSEKNNPIKTKERLSLSIDKGITLYADKTTNLDRFKDDFTQYQLAHPNDIVLNSMNMIVGAVGKSAYYGCVSPVYYVIYGKSANVDMDYYGYLLNIPLIRDVYHKLGQGIYAIERGDGRVNTCRLKVDYYEFSMNQVPVPSVKEQTEIANYLNEKNKEIDELIMVKQEKIDTLKQYRQSLIFEAVTGKTSIN